MPVSMIIINDVMAYMFGFFFGRTPLIKLSPKKTWEGYLGGGVATVLMGLLVRYRPLFRDQGDMKYEVRRPWLLWEVCVEFFFM